MKTKKDIQKGQTAIGVRPKRWYDKYVKNIDLILLLLPALVLLIIFHYVPMLGIQIAFKDFRMADGIWGSKWIGIENFQRLFTQSGFGHVIFNTLRISVCELFIGFVPPVVLAIMINEVKNKTFKRTVQTLTYLPHFFSWVILAGIFAMLFGTTGPVNDIIRLFGGKPLEVYSDNTQFIVYLISSHIWKGMGWSSILFLAAITGIDDSLFEAAMIDGASKMKQIMYITIPCMVPTMITVFIISVGSIMNAGFDQIYNMYNPVVFEVSDIIDTFVIRGMQSSDYSMSTAAGLFKSVVSLILVITTNKLANKLSENQYGLY